MRLHTVIAGVVISLSVLPGNALTAQHTTNLNNYFKYDQNVADYYRQIETTVIARQIATVDHPLGDQVMALENSKDFQIAFNNQLINALEQSDAFMRTHDIKTMLVELIAQTYSQVPQLLAQKSAEMVLAEQKTEIQAFAGDASNQFARLKGHAVKPGTWLTSVTDSPLGICSISGNSGRMELVCVPEQSGRGKDDLMELYKRTRDSIAEALSASVAENHDKSSEFHLMRLSTFSLKNGAEAEVGIVGDDRTSVVTFFRAPK